MSFPSDMTAPPAGALEACLALLEKATPGDWEATVEVFDKGGWEVPTQHVTVYSGDSIVASYSTAYEEFPDDEQNATNATALVAAVNLLRQHGPALLAALRLREGCAELAARIEREADAHTYFADNADLRMTAGDHAKRAVQLTTIRDDLARVLEESATGDEAASA